jgi:uncharacterized protein with GYD domain
MPASADSFLHRKGAVHSTYVSLAKFTDQGIKHFRDTVHRAEDFRGVVEKRGGQVRLQL